MGVFNRSYQHRDMGKGLSNIAHFKNDTRIIY